MKKENVIQNTQYDLLMKISARLDTIDSRLDTLGSRLDSIELRMDRIEARMDSIEYQLAKQAEDIETIHSILMEQRKDIEAVRGNTILITKMVGMKFTEVMTYARDTRQIVDRMNR